MPPLVELYLGVFEVNEDVLGLRLVKGLPHLRLTLAGIGSSIPRTPSAAMSSAGKWLDG